MKKEAEQKTPTLREFAPRFVDGYAQANRLKPSGIASKKTILSVHLIPVLGDKQLDQGERGERGAGVVPVQAVERLERQVEKMARDAEIQFRRIADLQGQLDVALAEIRRLKAGG